MNSVPPFSQNRGDIKYIRFEILQIMSPPEDVTFSNVRGLYLRKYGICNCNQTNEWKTPFLYNRRINKYLYERKNQSLKGNHTFL